MNEPNNNQQHGNQAPATGLTLEWLEALPFRPFTCEW